MNNRGLALIGFKLLGLYAIIHAAVSAFGIPYILLSSTDALGSAIPFSFVFVPILVGGLAGAGVWMGAERLASRLFPDLPEVGSAADGCTVWDPTVVALGILGAWLLVRAVPGIARGAALFLASLGYPEVRKPAIWTTTVKAEMVADVVQALVGLVLVRQPGGIAVRFAIAGRSCATHDLSKNQEEACDSADKQGRPDA